MILILYYILKSCRDLLEIPMFRPSLKSIKLESLALTLVFFFFFSNSPSDYNIEPRLRTIMLDYKDMHSPNLSFEIKDLSPGSYKIGL